MGISALITVFRNIENSLRNWQKAVEKQESTHYVSGQYLETYTIFSKTNFWSMLVILLKIKFNWKKLLLKCFFYSFLFCCVIFQRFFADFFVSFQYFLKRVSVLKFPLNATDYYAYNSAPSVKEKSRWRLLKQKWDKTEGGKNAKLFIKLFALSRLGSNYNLYT